MDRSRTSQRAERAPERRVITRHVYFIEARETDASSSRPTGPTRPAEPSTVQLSSAAAARLSGAQQIGGPSIMTGRFRSSQPLPTTVTRLPQARPNAALSISSPSARPMQRSPTPATGTVEGNPVPAFRRLNSVGSDFENTPREATTTAQSHRERAERPKEGYSLGSERRQSPNGHDIRLGRRLSRRHSSPASITLDENSTIRSLSAPRIAGTRTPPLVTETRAPQNDTTVVSHSPLSTQRRAQNAATTQSRPSGIEVNACVHTVEGLFYIRVTSSHDLDYLFLASNIDDDSTTLQGTPARDLLAHYLPPGFTFMAHPTEPSPLCWFEESAILESDFALLDPPPSYIEVRELEGPPEYWTLPPACPGTEIESRWVEAWWTDVAVREGHD